MKAFAWEVLRLASMVMVIEVGWVALTGEYLGGESAGWGDWL